MHAGDRPDHAVFLFHGVVVRVQGLHVEVGDAVPIGHHELIGIEISADAHESFAREGVFASFGKRDFKFAIGPRFVNGCRVRLGIQMEVRRKKSVLQEVFLDRIAFVSQAQDESVVAEMRVGLHDVPENRSAADRDHGFGFKFRFFLETGAFSSAKDHDRDRLTILHIIVK